MEMGVATINSNIRVGELVFGCFQTVLKGNTDRSRLYLVTCFAHPLVMTVKLQTSHCEALNVFKRRFHLMLDDAGVDKSEQRL